MCAIRYLCMSDLHLGEEFGLLTNWNFKRGAPDLETPSPVLVALVECLKFVLDGCRSSTDKKKPTLILNGDVLELALSPTRDAAAVFDQFIQLVLPEGEEMFDRITIVPGNHDHDLWQTARETQYVTYLTSGEFPPGKPLPNPWNTTNMFVEKTPISAFFLERLIRRHNHLKDMIVQIAYPNLGLLEPTRRKCVVFHHGHYIESIYYLMSQLKSLIIPDRRIPTNIWDIESENGPWINFFWSSLGNAGQVGEDLETVYQKLQKPDEVTELICHAITNFIDQKSIGEERLPFFGLQTALKLGVSPVVRSICGRERAKSKGVMSAESEEALHSYVEGPLRSQILRELVKRRQELLVSDVDEFDLVIGHTHKPFSKAMKFKGFDKPVSTFNTGGWVVDTVEPDPIHGAGLLLFNENLESVSIRMFNEVHDLKESMAQVDPPIERSLPKTDFYKEVDGLVNGQAPWGSFRDSLAERMNLLRDRLGARVRC
jgi:hypothetical protein